jgi:FkbM family methyltransferase
MKRPFILRILPDQLRQWVYFRRYHQRHEEWRDLFSQAQLSVCPAIAMHDLIPGDAISGSIAFNGFYELGLTKKISEHAARGGLLVDVGANMGYFALLWAGLSGTGKVIAFEAAPRNVALLENNIRRNHFEDRIAVIPKAAGDRPGTVTFDTGPKEQTGWGGIAAGDPENSIVVPMERLDEQLPDDPIEVLKIDTEGADALVLFGCERLLKTQKIKNIYFEENPDKIQRIGLAPGEAQRFLRKMKYECHCLDESGTEWFARPA